MQIYDSADVTGDGAAHTLASALGFSSSAPARAKWFQITTVANTSGVTARVGSANIGAARGIPVAGGQFAPPISQEVDFYDLQHIYYFLGAGDTASVAYAL